MTNAPIINAAVVASTCRELMSVNATRVTNWKVTNVSISTSVVTNRVKASVTTCRERTGVNVPRDSRVNDTSAQMWTNAVRVTVDVLTFASIQTDRFIASAVPDTKQIIGN